MGRDNPAAIPRRGDPHGKPETASTPLSLRGGPGLRRDGPRLRLGSRAGLQHGRSLPGGGRVHVRAAFCRPGRRFAYFERRRFQPKVCEDLQAHSVWHRADLPTRKWEWFYAGTGLSGSAYYAETCEPQSGRCVCASVRALLTHRSLALACRRPRRGPVPCNASGQRRRPGAPRQARSMAAWGQVTGNLNMITGMP